MVTAEITKQVLREGVHHCRHCGMKHAHHLRRANHKNMDALEVEVFDLIKTAVVNNLINKEYSNVHKEPIGLHLGVPDHQISYVFHRLNLKGFLGQAVHRIPHDSTRDPQWGGYDSAWVASAYPVHIDKFNELIDQEQVSLKPTRRKM